VKLQQDERFGRQGESCCSYGILKPNALSDKVFCRIRAQASGGKNTNAYLVGPTAYSPYPPCLAALKHTCAPSRIDAGSAHIGRASALAGVDVALTLGYRLTCGLNLVSDLVSTEWYRIPFDQSELSISRIQPTDSPTVRPGRDHRVNRPSISRR
jgi:hypothetical protein